MLPFSILCAHGRGESHPVGHIRDTQLPTTSLQELSPICACNPEACSTLGGTMDCLLVCLANVAEGRGSQTLDMSLRTDVEKLP